MKTTYTISGMSCNGCRTKVEKTLNEIDGIDTEVTLDPPIAFVHSNFLIPIKQLQEILSKAGNYKIETPNTADSKPTETKKPCCDNVKDSTKVASNYNGKYYCPMHCEGDKLYYKPGILLLPMIATLAMSFSSVSVIVNALRLRAVNLNT